MFSSAWIGIECVLIQKVFIFKSFFQRTAFLCLNEKLQAEDLELLHYARELI